MEPETWHVEIRCAACRFATMLDPGRAASWLLAAGRLRAQSEATRDELRELVVALAPQIACSACGQLRLTASIVADDPADWPAARRCDDCGELIPPERLEVFPDARLCTKCQRRDDRGVFARRDRILPDVRLAHDARSVSRRRHPALCHAMYRQSSLPARLSGCGRLNAKHVVFSVRISSCDSARVKPQRQTVSDGCASLRRPSKRGHASCDRSSCEQEVQLD